MKSRFNVLKLFKNILALAILNLFPFLVAYALYVDGYRTFFEAICTFLICGFGASMAIDGLEPNDDDAAYIFSYFIFLLMGFLLGSVPIINILLAAFSVFAMFWTMIDCSYD